MTLNLGMLLYLIKILTVLLVYYLRVLCRGDLKSVDMTSSTR